MPPITRKYPLGYMITPGNITPEIESGKITRSWPKSSLPESIFTRPSSCFHTDEPLSKRYVTSPCVNGQITLREYAMWKRLKEMEQLSNQCEELALRNSVLNSCHQSLYTYVDSKSSIDSASDMFDHSGSPVLSSIDRLRRHAHVPRSPLEKIYEENLVAQEAISAFTAGNQSNKSTLATSVYPDNENQELQEQNSKYVSPNYNDEDQPKVRVLQAWEVMIERIKEFKKEHGHCLVPWNYEKDRKLGSWVSKQRHYYSTNSLSQGRIEVLEAIGFVWNANKVTWNKMFECLVNYKKEHGNCLVPTHYKKDPKLGRWVYMQRTRKGKIEKDQVNRLKSLGFQWSVHKAFSENPEEQKQKKSKRRKASF